MHIAIATTEFVTEKFFSGGLANYTANLASILAEHGHEVAVFVLSEENEMLNWKENVTVYRMKYKEKLQLTSKRIPGVVRHYMQSMWNLVGASYVINKGVRRIHKKKRIDVIQYCDAGALAVCRPLSIPSLIRFSSYPALLRQAEEKDFDYNMAFRNLTQPEKIRLFAQKHVKMNIGPSRVIGDIIERETHRPVTIVESPVCVQISETDETFYAETLKNKKYFLFFGTLGYLKGVHLIAEIFSRLFEKYPDYMFVFVGSCQKMEYNGQKLSADEYIYQRAGKYVNRVMYMQPISDKKKLYAIIKHAEACVLPSRVDNLPNACIESMAFGKIVIGTEGASFEQLIQNGYNGWLIQRDDADDLFRKIECVINMNDDEKELFGERAQKRLEQMQPQVFYTKMLEIYRKVSNNER